MKGRGPMQESEAARPSGPTRTRYWVIVFAITLAIITYVDRVCMSQAKPDIQGAFALTDKQMGLVFSVFGLAYALFEIPMGWLGDRGGPRRILMKVVVLWSVFTAATGVATNYVSLLVYRFLFGLGEAGAFPNITKIFTLWLPAVERVRAQGIMWMSARWAGAFTPLLVVWMIGIMGWRWTFVCFGMVGVVWAVIFYRWFRDNPRDHPSINQAELALIGTPEANLAGHAAVPWKRFLWNRTVWMLWLQYFCMAYGWYFYITWLPTYLREARQLDVGKSALLAGLPLFFGGIGCLVSGLILNHVARWLKSTAAARRFMAYFGLTGAGVMFVLAAYLENPVLAMIAMGLSSFGNDLVMPGAWGACMDVGGKFAGSLSGSMNMMGNFAGFLAPMLLPWIREAAGGRWEPIFWVSGIIYLIGAISWVFIDPVTPLDRDEPSRATG